MNHVSSPSSLPPSLHLFEFAVPIFSLDDISCKGNEAFPHRRNFALIACMLRMYRLPYNTASKVRRDGKSEGRTTKAGRFKGKMGLI